MRIGTKQRPFYRVVAVDGRAKRTGRYIELLGTYNPLTEPHDIKLKQDRIDHWLKQGAQPSDGFLRMIGKAPQRPPRKPKKSKQGTVDNEQPKAEEATTPASEDISQPQEQPSEAPGDISEASTEEQVEKATPKVKKSNDLEQTSETESTPEQAESKKEEHNG